MKIQVDLPPKGPLLTKRDYEVDESKLPHLTDLIGLFEDSPVDIGGGWDSQPAKPTYTFVEFGEVMQEGDEYWSSTLEDWTTIEFSIGRQMANKGCVMRRKVK